MKNLEALLKPVDYPELFVLPNARLELLDSTLEELVDEVAAKLRTINRLVEEYRKLRAMMPADALTDQNAEEPEVYKLQLAKLD